VIDNFRTTGSDIEIADAGESADDVERREMESNLEGFEVSDTSDTAFGSERVRDIFRVEGNSTSLGEDTRLGSDGEGGIGTETDVRRDKEMVRVAAVKCSAGESSAIETFRDTEMDDADEFGFKAIDDTGRVNVMVRVGWSDWEMPRPGDESILTFRNEMLVVEGDSLAGFEVSTDLGDKVGTATLLGPTSAFSTVGVRLKREMPTGAREAEVAAAGVAAVEEGKRRREITLEEAFSETDACEDDNNVGRRFKIILCSPDESVELAVGDNCELINFTVLPRGETGPGVGIGPELIAIRKDICRTERDDMSAEVVPTLLKSNLGRIDGARAGGKDD
jgi:hypothetical protein